MSGFDQFSKNNIMTPEDAEEQSNIPVVRGTAKYGSKNDLYVEKGDVVVF
jgi:hypothetical protein